MRSIASKPRDDESIVMTSFWYQTSLHIVWWLCDWPPTHACMLSRFSHGQLFATHWTIACQAPLFMSSPGKNTGVDYHALLQRICTTQGSNPSPASPTLQADSLPLSHQGSPTDHTYPLPKRGKVILKFSWLPHMPGMMVAFPCVILFQAFQQPYELGIIIPIFLSETTKAHSS